MFALNSSILVYLVDKHWCTFHSKTAAVEGTTEPHCQINAIQVNFKRFQITINVHLRINKCGLVKNYRQLSLLQIAFSSTDTTKNSHGTKIHLIVLSLFIQNCYSTTYLRKIMKNTILFFEEHFPRKDGLGRPVAVAISQHGFQSCVFTDLSSV